jgi:clan AA aspartic protease
MIAGVVNEFREATIDLTLRGPAGHEERFEFVVDTGFTGGLTLHWAVAAALELPRLAWKPAVLGDGSTVMLMLSEAELLWNGAPRIVPVNISDGGLLLGMELLEGHDLYLRAIPDGEVRISAVRDAATSD